MKIKLISLFLSDIAFVINLLIKQILIWFCKALFTRKNFKFPFNIKQCDQKRSHMLTINFDSIKHFFST